MTKSPSPSGSHIVANAWQALYDPHARCRHSRLIHAGRITIGILICFAVTVGLGIPHGGWTPISFLIVIASLQHHGNVRARAWERARGTAIGTVAGVLAILEQTYLGLTPLTWGFIAVFCGACAYHAVDKGGYTALLAALTIIIVAGHGNDPLAVSLWRAVNVYIGIGIALLLTFALPIYATWFWRFRLAEALSGCASVYAGMALESPERQLQAMTRASAVLQQLRVLMPWVVRESGVAMGTLESVQRSLRIFFSTTELLLMRRTEPEAAKLDAGLVRQLLLELEAALSTGSADRLTIPPEDEPAQPAGDFSLAVLLISELDHLRRHLIEARALWLV